MNSPTDALPLLGVAVGSGAPDQGSADGPQALRDGGLRAQLSAGRLDAEWRQSFHAPRRQQIDDALGQVATLAKELAVTTESLTRAQRRFVSLGGDHSAAIGLWSGVARGARPGDFGLIWIDAHMDAHTFATTPSRMIHGMPVAALLGHGDETLAALAGAGAAVRPEHLCLIGSRSWEDGEAALLERLGVRVITMPEVARRGFAAALAEAVAIASDGTARFGVSIDIDAFDPAEITGTGIHVPDGLSADEVRRALPALRGEANFAGMEIAEYNPHRDRDHRTAHLIGELILATFGAA